MSTAVRRRLIALVSAAALSVAVPTAALADEGGDPHSTKPCPTLPSQSKAKGPKKAHKDNNGKDKGKKCGHHRVVNGN